MSNENEVVEETGVVATEEKVIKPRAKALSGEAFFELHEGCETLAEALEKTDMAEASYLQRCSSMRSAGWPLKSFPRRGGASTTPEAAAELIARIKGISVEQVKAEAEKLRAEAAKRAAAKAAKAGETQSA
jgi:hypothetical protein